MAKFITRRILLGILTLFAVSVIVFVATQALPGNAAQAILGKTATPGPGARARAPASSERVGLCSQFTHWLGGILTGNLGTSAATQEPVSQLLSGRIANSAFLVFVAAIIAIPLSIAFGSWMAVKRDTAVDYVGSTVSLVFASLPEFVIGIALVLLFATSVFHVLPAVSLIPPGDHAWDHPNAVILPVATLILAVTPYISRIMRGSMVEVLESDYVTMARLKGLPERTVIVRHAVPNAIVPAIQVSALQLAWMAGGIVLVEVVFSFPGVGALLVDAVGNRDVPTVQALALIIAAVYVVLNIGADVLTILVTPRLRTAER